jgi:hypothetical protein
MRLRRLLRPRNLAIGALSLFLLIQLVPVWLLQRNPPVERELAWPSSEAELIARRACFDCHSNETAWPLYSRVAPLSWLITYDVLEGREHFNISTWGSEEDRDDADDLREEIAEVIRDGEMPPGRYIPLHPEARLSAAEAELLIAAFQQALND